MTNFSAGRPPRPGMEPSIPQGEPLRTYHTYREAQKAVDHLASNGFAVQNLTIVGHDLKMVERVTGKLSYSRAAGAGAASGAWFGLFVGLLMSLFSGGNNNGLELALVGALFGAGFGMFFGITSYAMTKRQRDFTSASQVVASAYSIYVAPEQAGRAEQIMANFRGGPEAQVPGAPVAPPVSRPEDRSGAGPASSGPAAPGDNPFAYRGPQAPVQGSGDVAPETPVPSSPSSPSSPSAPEEASSAAPERPAEPPARPMTYSERIEQQRARERAEAAERRRAQRESEAEEHRTDH